MPQNNPAYTATGPTSQYEAIDPSSGRRWIYDGQKWNPADPQPAPGAAKRFLTQSVGLPEDVDTSLKTNIAALEEMERHPGKALWEGTKQGIRGLNPYAGITSTVDTALQRFKQPGLSNKVAGGFEYLVSGLPYAGVPSARAEEQAMRGDIAGSAGSLLNAAWSALALRAAPHIANMAATTGLRPGLRRIYGIGEPAVRAAKQDINEQASRVSGANEQLERQQTGRQFLDEAASHGADQIGTLAERARKDVRQQFNKRWDTLNSSIGPSTPVNFKPVEAARMQAEDFLNNPGLQRQFAAILKRAGFPDSLVSKEFIDTEEGLTPKPADNPPYAAAQRIYTQLGEEAEKLSGPDAGQLYRAVRTVQHPLGESMGAVHDAAGTGSAYRQLKGDYTDFMENFNDPGAPIRQLIDADTPEARMRVLQKYNLNDKVAGILDKYASPALGSQIRTLVRTMNDLPNAPSGQPKPVPAWPGTVEWREQQLQEKLRRQSQSSSPGEMAPGTFRTRTAAARQLGVSLLDNPAFRNWLSGRSEQLRPYNPPPEFSAPQPPTTGPAGPAGMPPRSAPSAPGEPPLGHNDPTLLQRLESLRASPEMEAARARLRGTAAEGMEQALGTIKDPKLQAELRAKYGGPFTTPAPPTTGATSSIPPWAIGPLLKSLREQSQRQAFEDLVKRLGGSGRVGPL